MPMLSWWSCVLIILFFPEERRMKVNARRIKDDTKTTGNALFARWDEMRKYTRIIVSFSFLSVPRPII